VLSISATKDEPSQSGLADRIYAKASANGDLSHKLLPSTFRPQRINTATGADAENMRLSFDLFVSTDAKSLTQIAGSAMEFRTDFPLQTITLRRRRASESSRYLKIHTCTAMNTRMQWFFKHSRSILTIGITLIIPAFARQDNEQGESYNR
jgi:hypothetical protein